MLITDIQKYKIPQPVVEPVIYMTDSEIIASVGKKFVFDVECYPNLFLVQFMDYETGKVISLEQSEYSTLNRDKLRWLVENLFIIGFNSTTYDEPMIWAAISGLSNDELKKLSDNLIILEMRPFEAEAKFGFKTGFANHVDLIEVAPSAGLSSLKQYAARMHLRNLQDLPFDPNAELIAEEVMIVRNYCSNDLKGTAWLYSKLEKAIALRENIGLNFELDLRSHSDAQISEAVIRHEIQARTGITPRKPNFAKGTTFQYQAPKWVKFHTQQMSEVLDLIKKATFKIDENGKVVMPKEIEELNIKIKNLSYQMGIGGLHSCEKNRRYVAADGYIIVDRDVASYYPQIILNNRFFPEHIGPAFLEVYGDIVSRRLQAKRDKDKTTADSLKITINGAFGKLGSKWSFLYSPHLMIQVTITGQLALLMLIEMLEWFEIQIISANTDGIVFRCLESQYEDACLIIKQWEAITNFETEETQYESYNSRDVNNYIAVTKKGEFKAKGEFVNELSMKEINRESLMKNPNASICSEAVMLFLKDETPIEKTIRNCKEFRKFVIVRKVKGGAVKDNCYLGRLIRWYMRANEFGCIRYRDNGNMVPDSMGGFPCMNMPNEVPKDIDYAWYINKSLEMLRNVGYSDRGVQLELFK